MNQFYWVENNSRSVEKNINYISVSVDGYTYQQDKIYCIEYMELEDPQIDFLKDEPHYEVIQGNYTLETDDIILLRLISKEEGINDYQDIFYGTYEELISQQYIIFTPYITFEKGDIILYKEETMQGYFPYQNLIIQENEITDDDPPTIISSSILETTYAQHYFKKYESPNIFYMGFNVYEVENWLEKDQIINIINIEKTSDTKCTLIINNQIISGKEEIDALSENLSSLIPEKIYFFSILKADGTQTLPSGDIIDNTCIIINYE